MEKVKHRRPNRKLKDYTGCVYGRLTAIERVERRQWLFRCECGNQKVTNIKAAQDGHTSSCGCLFREMLVARNTTHGLAKVETGTYRSWKDMRGRCRTKTNTDFHNYGGRGITVCERWDSFQAFFEDMGRRPEGTSIERLDVNGNYEPGNCVWADVETQANNKRDTRRIEIDGVTQSLSQWCRHYGVEVSKASYRLRNGLDPFAPVDYRR